MAKTPEERLVSFYVNTISKAVDKYQLTKETVEKLFDDPESIFTPEGDMKEGYDENGPEDRIFAAFSSGPAVFNKVREGVMARFPSDPVNDASISSTGTLIAKDGGRRKTRKSKKQAGRRRKYSRRH
jgi:hypothetical protein